MKGTRKQEKRSPQKQVEIQVKPSDSANATGSQSITVLLASISQKDALINSLRDQLSLKEQSRIEQVNDARNSESSKQITVLCNQGTSNLASYSRNSKEAMSAYNNQLDKFKKEYEKQINNEKDGWTKQINSKDMKIQSLESEIKSIKIQINQKDFDLKSSETSKNLQNSIISNLKVELQRNSENYEKLERQVSASRLTDEKVVKDMREQIKKLTEQINNQKGTANEEELQITKRKLIAKESETQQLTKKVETLNAQLTANGKRTGEIILKVQEIVEACLSSSKVNPSPTKWNKLKADFDKWKARKEFAAGWEKQALIFVKDSLSITADNAILVSSESRRIIDSLQKEANEKAKAISEKQAKINEQQTSLAVATRSINEKEETIKKCNSNNTVLQSQKSKISQDLSNKIEELKNLQKKRDQLSTELENTKAVLDIESSNLKKQKAKVKEQQTTIASKDGEIARYKKEIADSKAETDRFDKLNTELNKNLKIRESELANTVTELKRAKNDLEKQKQSNEQLDKKLKNQITTNATLDEKCNQQLGKITALTRNINAEIAEKKKFESKLLTAEGQNRNLSRQLEEINGLFKRSEEKIKQLDFDLSESRRSVVGLVKGLSLTFTGREEELDVRSIDFAESLEKKKNQFVQIYNRAKFFNGSVIVAPEKIDFIIKQLESYQEIKGKCKASNLIYRYDPLNPINFHKYFDGKERLISFVKLSNGTVIGGFTLYPFEQEKNEAYGRGKGFLFSLTLEKIFKQKIDARQGVTTYDGFYYIFGNAEIRIRTQEKKVFSNFGIATSTFDCEKTTRAEFLGVKEGSNNEVEIETYQMYQMEFCKE